MELIWTAHQGKHLLVSGFVHPPTETRSWETLKLIGEKHIVTIKGLEGSIELLPTVRVCKPLIHRRRHHLLGQKKLIQGEVRQPLLETLPGQVQHLTRQPLLHLRLVSHEALIQATAPEALPTPALE